MEIWLSIMVFALGVCFGSFVNMLIYRVAIKYEITRNKFQETNKKRSFCDFCGKQLKWYENIPVVSWMIQKGKTRCCRKKLPVLYPIVEIVTGMLFLIYWLITNNQISINPNNYQLPITNYQTLIQFFVGLAIVVFLVFSAVFDLKYMILPDFSTIILATLAVIGIIIGRPQESPVQFILAAVGAGGFLWLLSLIKIKGQEAMGLGDVKFAFFMGLLLGPQKMIVAFYMAFIVGALVSLVLIILKKANKKSLIAFGPFLILGTITAWFWGESIIKFLISNF